MTKFSGFASRRDDRLLQDVLWHRLTAACVTDSPLETAIAPEAELRCGAKVTPPVKAGARCASARCRPRSAGLRGAIHREFRPQGLRSPVQGTQSGLRTDGSECPTILGQKQVESWLRAAIAAGDVGGIWEPDTYPQLVWKRVDGLVFEGRVSNRDSGWYHGYPITAAEMPRWLE